MRKFSNKMELNLNPQTFGSDVLINLRFGVCVCSFLARNISANNYY